MAEEEIDELYKLVKNKISREEFDKKVSHKFDLLGKFTGKNSCAKIVVTEMGVDIQDTNAPETEKQVESVNVETKKINELKNKKWYNVNVSGRITYISDIHSFLKKDNTEGQLRNIVLSDKTGSIRMTVWDNTVDKFCNEYNVGDSITITNAYTKYSDYFKCYELCMSKNSTLEKAKKEVEWEEKYVLFKDIKENMYEINVKCVVVGMSNIGVFLRDDGSEGMVGELSLQDDKNQLLNLTLWDDNTVYLDTLSPGSAIDIKKAYSRMDSDGSIYLQLSKQGTITELSGETKK